MYPHMETSSLPDTLSARLILDSADPSSKCPNYIQDSFTITALDTARGVFLPLILEMETTCKCPPLEISSLPDTLSVRLILDPADPSSKFPNYIQATDMEYMVTSTRRSSQC